jgi:hypothetical protein
LDIKQATAATIGKVLASTQKISFLSNPAVIWVAVVLEGDFKEKGIG